MPISDEKRKGQENYAVAMAIMKEMKAKGIITKLPTQNNLNPLKKTMIFDILLLKA